MIDFMHRCSKDRNAGVALIFALTVIPVIGVIGLAIDFGLVTQAKTQLNLAADAAAMAAAKGAADAFTAGKSDYIVAGQAAGTEWFRSQAGTVLGTTLQDPAVMVTHSDAVFTSNVSYQGSVTPYFAPIFGVSKFALGGLSRATITAATYVSVTFLLDNSSSMLVAATQDDVNAMIRLTPISLDPNNPKGVKGPKGPKKRSDVPGFNPNNSDADLSNKQCAFACHWDKDQKDYYGMARQNNITLRFDVLQNAAVSAINQMASQQNPNISDQFALSVYTFDNGLTQLFPTSNQSTSTDLASGITAVKNFETPVVQNDGNTNFPKVMNDLTKKSTAAGDGSSSTSRKKALIIVTDGLADYQPRHIPDSEGPINPADCAAMKSLGYSVYVLYTTFVTTPLDAVLLNNHGLLPYLTGTDSSAMVPSLQACASAPANFAQASDPAAISTAMTQLLQAAIGSSGRYIR